ncbi:MAG TPA: protein translocase subunit SecF [Candidatus Dormibacteraeota bacterium]|nr:protein translocase subunit SecF [Candidatus Dormibacteraeota bacterium]
MNIIGRRKIWYAISLIIIIPGTISLLVNGLRLGIDFTGGTLMEVQGRADAATVRQLTDRLDIKDVTVIASGSDRSLIRFRDESKPKQQEAHHQILKRELSAKGLDEIRYEAVGPTVSRDLTRNALVSIAVVSVAIVLYIAFAFRNVPPPLSSYSFGFMAIAALLHDALLLLGIFSLLGAFFGVEIDVLFVTAILTVIGFSVHDTIVVFDRIRENLRRERKPFEDIVNQSIIETLARSLNTSVTVLLTLLALYLFGGQSIKQFVLALLIGIAAGTYSSIFNASPLLVTWNNWRAKRAG